jgi:hypothetical protein
MKILHLLCESKGDYFGIREVGGILRNNRNDI